MLRYPVEKKTTKEPNREKAQIRQTTRTGRDTDTDEEQERTVKKKKGIGFVVTASSPMEEKMCVHMLQ